MLEPIRTVQVIVAKRSLRTDMVKCIASDVSDNHYEGDYFEIFKGVFNPEGFQHDTLLQNDVLQFGTVDMNELQLQSTQLTDIIRDHLDSLTEDSIPYLIFNFNVRNNTFVKSTNPTLNELLFRAAFELQFVIPSLSHYLLKRDIIDDGEMAMIIGTCKPDKIMMYNRIAHFHELEK